jgi:hypothetical protein
MSRALEIRVGLPPGKADEIRAELERVLASPQFAGSKRCQKLLRHITEHCLSGDGTPLKERMLGVEVFGRDPDYDTGQDPVVRAAASETRKKLAQYYQQPGHENEPRIELLSGSYAVEFHGGEAPPPVKPVPEAWVSRRRLRLALTAAAGLVLTGVAVALMLFLLRGGADDSLNRLWTPLLKAPGSVLICVGQPITYNLRSTVAQDAIQARPSRLLTESLGDEVVRKKDLVILHDRYVALGDAVCLVHLAEQLQKFGKPYRIRGERSTSFADLRRSPAVFISAFDNQWTLREARQLRFTFVKDSANDTDMVRDRQQPGNAEWRLTGAWPFWDVASDYAIVSRILNCSTEAPAIIAAGITEYGTKAAGEFVTTPEYFAQAVARLPKGWEKMNLQIVLKVPVVNRVSGQPQILATHVW